MFYKKQFLVRMANYNKFGFMVVVFPLIDGEFTLGNTIFHTENGTMKPLNLLYVEIGRRKVLSFAKGCTCSLFFEADINQSISLENDYLYVKMTDMEIKEVFESKIQEIRIPSAHRPLLARESLELVFLEKMLQADSLVDLQNIENEINSTPTDPELITRLQKYVTEKKAFY